MSSPASHVREVDPDTGHMLWDGPVTASGHPYCHGKAQMATHWFYELYYGVELPVGVQLKRWCVEPRCISPHHNPLKSPRGMVKRLAGGTAKRHQILLERLVAVKRHIRAECMEDRSDGLRIDYTALQAVWVPGGFVQETATRLSVSKLLVLAATGELLRESWRLWKYPRRPKNELRAADAAARETEE